MKNIIVLGDTKHKWCHGCKKYWPVIAFRVNDDTYDGLYALCRKCVKDKKKRKRSKIMSLRHTKKTKQIKRARVHGAQVFFITKKDMIRLLNAPCSYESSLCSGKPTLEHIIPLSRGGTHGIGNLTNLCQYHNSSKGSKLHIEYKYRRNYIPVYPSTSLDSPDPLSPMTENDITLLTV